MMDLGTIRALSRDTGNRAKRHGVKPWHPETVEDITYQNLRRIPMLGDYTPRGYERTEVWFVDKTGMDTRGPAMSPESLVAKLREYQLQYPHASYAITEEGQFQLYVTAFLRQPKIR